VASACKPRPVFVMGSSGSQPSDPPTRAKSEFHSKVRSQSSKTTIASWPMGAGEHTEEENVACRGQYIMENVGKIDDFYKKEAKAAAGSDSTWKATNKSTGATCAINTISKRRIKDVGRLKLEVSIMKQLDHPNVIKLYETFEDATNIHMVTEYCAGGDLFDRIEKQGRLAETQAAAAMRQLLQAVRYLHEQCVCHRDLKPENLLFESQEEIETNHLKVLDLAHAARFDHGQTFKTKSGTPFYVAPETLQGKYTHAVDLWSCGVIMYITLCGYPPFTGATDAEVLSKVRKGVIHFRSHDWKEVSKDAEELVKQLLQVSAKDRCTASEAVNHTWIARTAPAAPATQLQPNVVENLRRFRAQSRLKKAALQIVADRLEEGQIKELREMFLALDTDGDGILTGEEIKVGLDKAGFTEVPGEIMQILDGVDSDGNGVIDYTEFLAASLDKQIYTQEDACWSAFRVFDRDGDGKISMEELQHVLKNDPSLAEALQQYDRDGDGSIDFEEFRRMMRKR